MSILTCFNEIEWVAISAIATSIYSILTIASLLILWYTLREIRNSRRESYKPKILIKSEFLYLQLTKFNIPFIWKKFGEDAYTKLNFPQDNSHGVTLINTGLGPAIDVKLLLIPNQKNIISTFEKYKKLHPDKIIVNDKKIILKSKSSTTEYELFQEGEVYTKNILSLLPYDKEEKVIVYLPKSLILYISTIVYFETLNDPSNLEYNDIPPIGIVLKYKDVSNTQYTEYYNLLFRYINIEGGSFIKEDHMSMYSNENKAGLEMVLQKSPNKKNFNKYIAWFRCR